ncbi:MAG: metallophosphoesterase [candidate division Zixibacteria bacterium]|nr:metallophosphoesterase [candidate division Zixibacteria bacterium]
MFRPFTFFRVLPLVLVSFLAGTGTALADEDADSVTKYDDGPHVYWTPDGQAIVFYLCDGEFVQQRYPVARNSSDTLTFAGACEDSITRYVVPAKAPLIPPSTYDNVTRVLAVSDLHGEYDAFRSILATGGVVDKEGHWNWGSGHLVINGDVFDRGEFVTECLWLIYRLEQEAQIAGGRVHYLLGNHELMVLRGDNRYIHKKYLKGICRKTRIDHQDLYGPDMELGRWLRTKPTMIRINDILFVHAGVSPEVLAEYDDMGAINRLVRAGLDVSSPELTFGHPSNFLYRSSGPLWFRGFFGDEDYEPAGDNDLTSVLNTFNATAMVVGHTEWDSIQTWYDGRMISIDVPVKELGGLQALEWRDGMFYRVHVDGSKTVIPRP